MDDDFFDDYDNYFDDEPYFHHDDDFDNASHHDDHSLELQILREYKSKIRHYKNLILTVLLTDNLIDKATSSTNVSTHPRLKAKRLSIILIIILIITITALLVILL